MNERSDLEKAADDTDRGLQDMIEHWVSVMDQWVRKFDRETGGGTADGADLLGETVSPTDPAPEAT